MDFLSSTIQELNKLKGLADKAIAQTSDEDLHWQPDEESNSIAIIMKHMAGNMFSRWTDFLTTDGEKPNRNRDGEFVDDFTSRRDLIGFWDRGWSLALQTIGSLSAADLEKTVYIRSEAHSVPLAIVRQIAHYASHVGQIVYIAKHRRGQDWKTLSIPRNRSNVV
jgi:hypothetical protein